MTEDCQTSDGPDNLHAGMHNYTVYSLRHAPYNIMHVQMYTPESVTTDHNLTAMHIQNLLWIQK
jgi:hypothetical protein